MSLMFFCVSYSSEGRMTSIDISKKLDALNPDERDQYDEIGNKLRCPTCTGLSVLQSESPFSLQIRNSIISQIKERKNERSIIQFFKDRYGHWIFREPPKKGFHIIAWILPFFIIAAAGFSLRGIFSNTNLQKQKRYSDFSEKAILTEMEMMIQNEKSVKS